jgi:hypothetical protein
MFSFRLLPAGDFALDRHQILSHYGNPSTSLTLLRHCGVCRDIHPREERGFVGRAWWVGPLEVVGPTRVALGVHGWSGRGVVRAHLRG